MQKLENNYKYLRNEVFSQMLQNKGAKYKSFLMLLRTFKYASLNPTKGSFLESYYTYMRYIDDVVDGDAPLPKKFQSRSQFIEDKIKFSKHLTNPQDPIDYLMLYCVELGNKLKLDFTCETEDILTSMLFDAKRIGQRIIFPEKELSHHFHLLDIRGTIKATMKIFGEDASEYKILEPLGMASRFYYDVRDLAEDLVQGLINLSLEDAQRLNINDNLIIKSQEVSKNYLSNKKSLEDELKQMKFYDFNRKTVLKSQLDTFEFQWYENLPENVLTWAKEHTIKTQEYLKIHSQQNISEFNLLSRMTLPLAYGNRAEKYCNKFLKTYS